VSVPYLWVFSGPFLNLFSVKFAPLADLSAACDAKITLYSSISFNGVVIDTTPVNKDHPIIQLQLGYPDSSFFRGEDPRYFNHLARDGS
jgi:hypothetical protein